MENVGSTLTITLFVLIAVAVGVMLWLNPDAPSSTNQIATLLGALALACIAVSPFFKAEEKYSFYTVTLFRDSDTGAFMAGPAFHPYWDAMGPLLAGLPSTSSAFGPAMRVDEEKVPELLQFMLVRQLFQSLSGSWDAQIVDLPGVYGGTQASKLILSSPNPSDKIDQEQIRKVMADNSFVSLLNEGSMQVPMGTTFAVGPPTDRYIELKTNDFKIMVAVVGWRGATINQPVWGVIDPPVETPIRYRILQYTVVVKGATGSFRRYPKGIESYWKWYENVKGALSEIDWKTIDAAMVDQSRRTEYPQVLDQIMQRHRAHSDSN